MLAGSGLWGAQGLYLAIAVRTAVMLLVWTAIQLIWIKVYTSTCY